MLSISGINEFYYIRDFHDMRCKYERVRSVIREQLRREPEEGEVFIMMSRDRRIARLYEYDGRSCCLHEKRFKPGYSFMQVKYEGGMPIYRIRWEDVLVLMESPVIKTLRIN